MAERKHEGTTSELNARNREAGAYLRRLRERKGIVSGAEMNRLLGRKPEDYRWILQVEQGRRPLPSSQIPGWARVLGVDEADLTRSLFRLYEPLKFALLYGHQQTPPAGEPHERKTKWKLKWKPKAGVR